MGLSSFCTFLLGLLCFLLSGSVDSFAFAHPHNHVHLHQHNSLVQKQLGMRAHNKPATFLQAQAQAQRGRGGTSSTAVFDLSSSSSRGLDLSSTKNDVKSVQIQFLSVFWLLRMADWLHGPYFYDVYASKVIAGTPVSVNTISKLFLIGFSTAGLFGPLIGRLVDTSGRKMGTLAFTLLYTFVALSIRSDSLLLLVIGRICGGFGTALLAFAPESWLVTEHSRSGHAPESVAQTLRWAYAGNALVAIAAGGLASLAARKLGPTGPYTVSLLFLVLGAILTSALWNENSACDSDHHQSQTSSKNKSSNVSITDACRIIFRDKRILLVGGTQALFEAAMYIFVLQWVPALRLVVNSTNGGTIPLSFGTIFSCFMMSSLLGTAVVGIFDKYIKLELLSALTMVLSALSMTGAVAAMHYMQQANASSFLLAAFLAFEMCVGMYYPIIGAIRSKYLPEQSRSTIKGLFGIPLNFIVAFVFLSLERIGIIGSLQISVATLVVASACMTTLSLWR